MVRVFYVSLEERYDARRVPEASRTHWVTPARDSEKWKKYWCPLESLDDHRGYSWWSGCGGNSNLFFSYNHCMFVCGEFAKRGPGIDEKYWASRNRSMPLGGGQRPYQPYVHPSMQLVAEQRPQPPRVRPSSGYKQIDRDRGRYDGYRDRQNDSFASGYAEFRTLPSHNSSPQAQSYLIPYRSSTQRRPRGERIYRYDTGPIKQTHPDGTVTINRQVIYITENRRPSMTLHQRLPGLIEFTHITPPPPFSTMITPLLRRRLKKLMKEKVLPRTTNPPKISSPIPEQETHFERGSVVREDVTQPSIAPSSVRAKDTTDENYNYIRHSTSRESDGRRSTLPTTSMTYRNQGSTLTTSQYPLRYQPDMKQTSAKPVVTDAEHSLRSSPSPIIRIEAERLDISRPVVISVSPKEVDFDEVLAIDSKIYDDYDDTFNDLNFDNTHPELPTTATSVPIGITPSNKMESRHHTSTLKPIVSPPASSQELSTTQADFGEEDTETVGASAFS
uniref:BPTI/Kunitz inhibitor domain-containing protein n=1 Tax=Angiostrongylus cantonensis TaxID=6313 RepID=A0A158P698_ANGCA